MELSEEEYRIIYMAIERCIMQVQEPAVKRKIQHSYFVSSLTMESYDRLYAIICAEIRQRIEKVFDKYIDEDLARQVRIESEKRKRPRKKKIEADKDVKSTSSIGEFVVESLD